MAGRPEGDRNPPRLPRSVLAVGFALVLASLLAAVTTSWAQILGRLTRAPQPTARGAAPVTTLLSTSVAERALSDARRFLADGQAQQALRALDQVLEQDPEWPYARRLRAEAEAALVRAGGLR